MGKIWIFLFTGLLCLYFGTGCMQGESLPMVEVLPGEEAAQVLKIVHFIEPQNPSKKYDVGVGALLEEFTAETGIRIELTTLSWDQLDRELVVSNTAGMPSGDLYVVSSQKLAYLLNHNALLPLDSYLAGSFSEDVFSPAVLEAGRSQTDGKLYLMLQSIHTRGLWYNKEYVQTPPKTLEELVQISKEISRPSQGFYGFGFWGGAHYGSVEQTIAPLVWAGGGHLATSDGKADWASPATVDALQFMSDCVYEYKIASPKCLQTYDYSDIQNDFYSGKLGMIIDGSHNYHLYKGAENGKSKFGFAPLPGKEGPAPNFSNGWAWGIPSNSAQPDLAWNFIEWFEQQEIQLRHAILEGGLPTQKEVYQTMAEIDPLYGTFTQVAEQGGRPMDPFVYYQEALEELAAVSITFCLDPQYDPLELLQKAQDTYNNKYT